MHNEIFSIITLSVFFYTFLFVLLLLWRNKVKITNNKQILIRKKQSEMNKTILSMTKSNNSYPDLLQVFNNLETKLVDNDMEFKMDFRGYLNYDSERK